MTHDQLVDDMAGTLVDFGCPGMTSTIEAFARDIRDAAQKDLAAELAQVKAERDERKREQLACAEACANMKAERDEAVKWLRRYRPGNVTFSGNYPAAGVDAFLARIASGEPAPKGSAKGGAR